MVFAMILGLNQRSSLININADNRRSPRDNLLNDSMQNTQAGFSKC
jgi:hypothetical protein